MIDDPTETTTNWAKPSTTFSIYSSDPKWIKKLHTFVKEYPGKVKISFENNDGSLCCELPIRWFKVSPPRKMSKKQKEAASERMSKMWEEKKKKTKEKAK